MFRRILALCALLFLAYSAFAQAEGTQTSPDPLAAMSELERKTLALDIAVSNYYELKAMAARYGLSVAGTSDELRARIYQYLKLSPPTKQASASSVTIESASTFEYFTLDGSSDRMIKLSGPVSMSVKTDDGFSHKVTADEIIFDRDKNIIQAKGDVVYLREGGGRSDKFSGSTITVDLGSYSGVFLDGAYNLEPTATTKRTLSFHFEKLTKRGPDLTMLDQAIVTGCDEVPPHYHIRAKKVWLFENGDWALSGATLYLGVVPVIWLPFFYYPSDEILFHPVIGYRSRVGAFAQTTTYLIGEKNQTTDTSSSLSLFSQQNATGSKELSGIFIQRLQSKAGTAAESGGSAAGTGAKLKLLADIYSALGVYLGVAGNTPETKSVTLDYSFGLGVSRSLFLESSGYYSPFDYANSYVSVWNASNFLGFDLPFRFGLDFSYSYKKTTGPLRFSVAIKAPLFSDPYFEQDFMQRNESSGILSAMNANTTTIAKRTSMTQSLQSNLTWTPPNAQGSLLLEKADISKLAAQMTWKSKTQSTTGLTTAQKRLLAVDPQRDFYYPDTLKPLDGAFSLSGTLFRYDSKASRPGVDSGKVSGEESGSSSGMDKGAAAEATGSAAKNEEKVSAAQQNQQPQQTNARDFSQFSTTMGWSASGAANVEEKFYTSAWTYPEDVDGALSYLLLGWKGTAKLASATDWAQKLVSMQTSLGFSSQDQWRPYLYDDRTAPTTVHPYRLSDYAYKMTSLDASAVLALSPFLTGSAWSASSLQYSIGGTVYKYGYAGLSGSGVDASPLYESTWIGWNRDTLNTHNLAATLSLAPRNRASQKLSFSAYLPPLLEKYSATYSLSAKYFKASLSGAVSRATELADLVPSSLSSQIVIGSSPFPTLKSDFSWDFDAAAPLSSVTSLEYGWAKLAFTAQKSKGYTFSDGLWSTDGSESFRPYEASFTLAPKIGQAATAAATTSVAGNSLKLSILPTISYTQNLVRFTESTLGAGMDLSLTSPQGTSLSFTSSSANKSAWRYWPSLFPVTSSFDPNDYYRNIFSDLAASLSLWDTAKLKSSLFKLQSLSLKLSQDLHDWNFQAALAMSPVLVTPDSGRPYYQLDFSFSLSVTWKDIPELKASVGYQDGGFTE